MEIFSILLLLEGVQMKHIIKGNKEDVVEAISNCVIGFKAKRNREIILDCYLDGMQAE